MLKKLQNWYFFNWRQWQSTTNLPGYQNAIFAIISTGLILFLIFQEFQDVFLF